MAKELINKEIEIIDENSIKNKIYIIRGVKVMLDFELAEIYGYETRYFNRQVKNNLEKFDGFMFQLTTTEVSNLVMCKKFTSRNNMFVGQKGGTRKLPYAFTEQGIYMLMTVLRGPLAVEQSRKLVTVFKDMKDYIEFNNNLLPVNEVLRLSNQVNQNTSDIKEVKDQLSVMMDNFIDPSKYKEFLILEGEKFKADVAYKAIFFKAKKSIVIVDNYISYKTLDLLRGINSKIEVTIYSDNVASDRITDVLLNDFIEETKMPISIKRTSNDFHDRFIILDKEKVYISGPSLKDAGNKISTIINMDYNVISKQIIAMFK